MAQSLANSGLTPSLSTRIDFPACGVNPFRVQCLHITSSTQGVVLELTHTLRCSTSDFAQCFAVRYNPDIQPGQLKRREFVRSFKRHFRGIN